MAAFLLNRITCSLAIMSIEANSLSKPFVCCSRTKLNTLRISSWWEATTSALRLTESTGSMMNVRSSHTQANGATISSFGKRLLTVSTVFQLQLLLTIRSFACTEGSPLNSVQWTKSEESCGRLTCPIQVKLPDTRTPLRLALVRPRKRGARVGRERPRSQFHFWSRDCECIPQKTWLGPHLSSALSCWRRLWIFCEKTTGDPFLCT